MVRCGAQARGLTESRRPLPWPSSWENQGLGMQVASQQPTSGRWPAGGQPVTWKAGHVPTP